FLMEQMDLREELAGIREQADPYASILDLAGRINKQIKTLVGQMAVQFESATPDQLEAAREILRKLRFLQKLRREAESVEAEIEDEIS
ncbi:MAG: iron-sulfur cluster co-chaperone HscB C-terminal domain-containing protein, partial [Pseudomonadota bacterium]